MKRQVAMKIIHKVALGWEAIFNYKQDDTGRIWMIWNPTYCNFSATQVHDQFIHGKMREFGSNKSFIFTVVHGLHKIADRK